MKSQFAFLTALIVSVVFFSCEKAREVTIDPTFQEEDGYFYFYTIGDWGRRGQFGQQELGNTMGKAARVVEPEFFISTGDNFYPDGVASVDDPAWKYSYEDVYKDHSLNEDWYVVLGNHDYRGNPQAEIDYTNISQRWNMPARYFHKDIVTDEGVKARFLFVDTSPLNDEYYQNDSKYRDKVMGIDTTQQLQWIDSMLTVDVYYKIVVGHHPLYTGGKRIDDRNYVRPHLESLLDKHKVDLYLAGHEHDLQHIKPAGHVTHHIVSGAGSDIRPTGKLESSLFARSIQGFLVTGIHKDHLRLQFMDVNGAVIHEHDIPR